MTHFSENSIPLMRKVHEVVNIESLSCLPNQCTKSDVWFIIMPWDHSLIESRSDETISPLVKFSDNLHEGSTLCILTSQSEAINVLQILQEKLTYQLWISIKLDKPLYNDGFLVRNHCTLLVLTKYSSTLKHSKTRIAYSFCPACDKTTKDYGGKKHLYHEYGTLMSDVWRDIVYCPSKFPETITKRLLDLFGIPPYDILNVVDLSSLKSSSPSLKQTNKCKYKKSLKNSRLIDSCLINEDCLSALKTIPSDSIDFCFADPPYNLKKKYQNYKDDLDIIEYFNWCDEWCNELIRVLKPGKTCAILNIPLWSVRHFIHLNRIAEFHTWITWDGLSLPVRKIMPANYSILCFSKGLPESFPGFTRKNHSIFEDRSLKTLKEGYCLRSSCINNRINANIQDKETITDLWWDIHRLKHNASRLDHPCQLPPNLMYRLISLFTNKGDIVLDPFDGIGTTTLSAHQLERYYIGIEICKEYHNTAQERHRIIDCGGDPFEKNNKVPKAKNSRVKRLKKQKYVIPKKTLQLEVREIAERIGHIPSRQELEQLSSYPINYYDEYFIDWGEVCAAARTTGMNEDREPKKDKKRFNYQMNFDDL